jgi:hypothetical protein
LDGVEKNFLRIVMHLKKTVAGVVLAVIALFFSLGGAPAHAWNGNAETKTQATSFASIFTYISDLIFGSDPVSETTAKNAVLSRAVAAGTGGDKYVVTMEAGGDLPGSMSLILERDPDSGTISGEWVLVVSYIEDLGHSHRISDAKGLNAPNHDDGHGGERLINKGTIRGTVTGGRLTLNADQKPVSIEGATLSVISGSLEFSALSSGSGTVEGTNLDDIKTSVGSLALRY